MKKNTLKFKYRRKNSFHMKKEFVIIVLAVFFMVPPLISAADFDHVIANSEKWTDVYSSMMYAHLQKVGSDFLVSTQHAPILLNGIQKEKRIMVVTSDDRPYVFNYPDLIESRGFPEVQEISSDNLNTELIRDLPDVNNFVVVGDSFGYNSLAVAPYAVKTNAWVFLANRNNVYEIDSILSRRNINNLLIYGFVDQEVTSTLSKYNPEIINTGDRFEDNIEIVKKYLKLNPTEQTILTNGEFIEREIMSGSEPVLFTGKENVPPIISDYLKNSEIEVGVLIGNDLVGAAQNIKESSGIYVMVKFARSARAPDTGIAAVEGLDLFPVPSPNMQLILHSVKYNQASSQLEVTYQSNSNIPVYFKGTITIDVNGERKKVGDLDPIFIAPGDFKTIIYPLELTKTDNVVAEVYTLYGETPSSLEKILSQTMEISAVNVIDACKLQKSDVKSVKYSRQKESIIVSIKNPHEVDCWVDLELTDISIGFSKKTLGTGGSTRITAGNTKKIYIEQELTDTDLENNKFVDMTVLSGEREDSLVHTLKDNFELTIESFAFITYAIIGLIILIVALVVIIIVVKRRQEEYY